MNDTRGAAVNGSAAGGASTSIRSQGHAVDYPADTHIDAHRHRSHQIVHAAEGVMRVVCAQGVWVVPPGRALWMPAGLTHAIDCIGTVAMRTVYLGGEHPSFPAMCAVWRLSPFLRELILRLADNPEPGLAAPALQLLLHEIETIEAMPLHVPEPADARLRRITAHLLVPDNIDTSLTDLARIAGMSPRSFIRHFQSDTGMTLRQWRRQARLLLALEKLGAGENVSSAAYGAGYASASAFVHAFGEIFGTTPGRYFREPTRAAVFGFA